jgi:hypothetical protein
MSDHTFSQAQADMRSGYFSGVPGMFVSGVVWLTAGGVTEVLFASLLFMRARRGAA